MDELGDSALLAQTVARLDRVIKFTRGYRQNVSAAAVELTGAIKTELADAFDRSGCGVKRAAFKATRGGDDPAALYQASVAGVTVTANVRGLRIFCAGGMDENVYRHVNFFRRERGLFTLDGAAVERLSAQLAKNLEAKL